MKSIFTGPSFVALIAGLGLAFSGCAQWGQDREQEQQQEESVWGEEQQQEEQSPEEVRRDQQEQQEMGQERHQEGDKTVKKAQKALEDRGYLQEEHIDGMYGPNTEQAIRSFQAEEGLSVTGQLDDQTLSALDIDREDVERRPAGVEEQQEEEDEGFLGW